MEHRNGYLSNVIFNGSNNLIICTRKNYTFHKIDNGSNNVVSLGPSSASSASSANSANNANNASNANNANNGNNGNNNFEAGTNANHQNSGTTNHTSHAYSQNNVNNNHRSFTNTFSNSNSTSNYTIRIDNNIGGDSNFFEFINNITGNLNMNIQFNNSDTRNRNHIRVTNNNIDAMQSDSSFESEENSMESINLEEADGEVEEDNNANDEEAYREFLLQKRSELIEDLNVFQFKHVDKFVVRKDDTCAICLEKFKNPDLCKQFSCSEHIFHKTCLESWLKSSNYCPLCKYDLMDDVVVEDN